MGKSSLLKAICGLYRFSGNIILNGQKVGPSEVNFKKDLCYCPDDYQFSPSISPDQYIRFVLAAYKQEIPENYAELVSSIGVSKQDFYHKKIADLSYGTIKKLLILATSIINSDVYIFDEPTNGLDEIGREYLQNFVDRHQQSKLFLIACHDPAWVGCLNPRKIELV